MVLLYPYDLEKEKVWPWSVAVQSFTRKTIQSEQHSHEASLRSANAETASTEPGAKRLHARERWLRLVLATTFWSLACSRFAPGSVTIYTAELSHWVSVVCGSLELRGA